MTPLQMLFWMPACSMTPAPMWPAKSWPQLASSSWQVRSPPRSCRISPPSPAAQPVKRDTPVWTMRWKSSPVTRVPISPGLFPRRTSLAQAIRASCTVMPVRRRRNCSPCPLSWPIGCPQDRAHPGVGAGRQSTGICGVCVRPAQPDYQCGGLLPA